MFFEDIGAIEVFVIIIVIITLVVSKNWDIEMLECRNIKLSEHISVVYSIFLISSKVRKAYTPPPVPPNFEAFTAFSFKWTSTEYTPVEFLDNFQKYTPFLFMTTQGYLGRDELMNTVASNEVSMSVGESVRN